MEDHTSAVALPRAHLPATVSRVHVGKGALVERGAKLFTYTYSAGPPLVLDCDSPYAGTVAAVRVRPGQTITAATNAALVEVREPCAHAVQLAGLCALCGKDVSISHFTGADTSRATIQMTHDASGLVVSAREAARIERETVSRLRSTRKLSLLLDLDQTIIQATVDPTVGEWLASSSREGGCELLKDVFSFVLPDSPTVYYVKLRPFTREFLAEINEHYEMHVYTMGTRHYANAIARIIDPDNTLFRERILSRDESGSFAIKSIQRLFPCDQSMVIVVDDRADVWQWSPNLIKVKPYEYFIGIGDINEPLFAQREKSKKKKRPSLDQEALQQIAAEAAAAAAATSTQPAAEEQADEKQQEALYELELEQTESLQTQIETRPLKSQRIPDDTDTELQLTLRLIREVHDEFFAELAEGQEKPDAGEILSRKRRRVLDGCVVCFSGYIRLGDTPSRYEWWNMAEWFGARCTLRLEDDSVTHLVCHMENIGFNINTKKIRTAREKGTIYVVTMDWLINSILAWNTENELNHLVDPSMPFPTARRGTSDNVSASQAPTESPLDEADLEIARTADRVALEKSILDEIDAEIEDELGSSSSDFEEGQESVPPLKQKSSAERRKRKRGSDDEGGSSGTGEDSASWKDFEESLENELRDL